MKLINQNIGVIGAGAMGSGIAQIAAQAGCQVQLIDTNEEALDRSAEKLTAVMKRLVVKNRVTADESANIIQRIQRSTEFGDLADCGLVIEAVVEDAAVKAKVFRLVEAVVSQEAVLASNTSSFSITAIASKLKHPERLLGLHFFNPAPVMALVEVIPALQTDSQITDACVRLMKDWGKQPVVAKDTPGFIVNRLARPFYGEAFRILEEGVHNAETIDAAMRDVGFRMGPFELMDLIGNDVNYAVTESVFASFYFEPRYRPSITQRRYVEAGWLGRKTGKGYYTYDENGQRLTSDNPILPAAEAKVISNRIVAMLINEAAEALRLGIATSSNLDQAMTHGVNYPKGLLAWANEWGLQEVLHELQSLHGQFNEERYRPSPMLQQLCRDQKRFSV